MEMAEGCVIYKQPIDRGTSPGVTLSEKGTQLSIKQVKPGVTL